MKTFRQYLDEAAGKGLTIFDIDDTFSDYNRNKSNFPTSNTAHYIHNGAENK